MRACTARVAAFAFGLAVVAASSSSAQDTALPRYALSIEAELEHMGVTPRCASEPRARHHCVWTLAGRDGEADLAAHAVYSDESDAIYFYLERYLVVPSDHPRAAAVLRRLMEINWDILVGKLEWNPRSGEVRLSATLNTDSNFDRRAFRSILRALDRVAHRYRRELRSLAVP